MRYSITLIASRVRELCIKHNYCDMCTNKEYQYMLENIPRYPEPETIKALAKWIHEHTSDTLGAEPDTIEFAILNEAAFTTIY